MLKTSDVKQHSDLARFDPELLVIKLGSGVVTTDVGTLDLAVLRDVADFVAARLSRGCPTLIVSSGAVASGIGEMGLKARPKGLPAKQALAAIGQSHLMARWDEAFAPHGRHAAQILLSAEDFQDRRRYLNMRYTLEQLFEFGVVPIFNENDTITVDELRFGENDGLALLVAIKMMADMLIFLTNAGGLYASMPRAGEKPRIVERVEHVTPEIEAMADGKSAAGSGGMASKLQAAKQAARSGILTLIAPGKQKGILNAVFSGRGGGTLFLADEGAHLNRRQRYIAFNRLAARGRVWIDEGAVKALTTGKKSLLPAGVRKTDGRYARHDIIEVLALDGAPIARGMTNYSSDEVAAIMGRKTTEIEKVLGARDYDEVIHRDNLVVLDDAHA